MSLKAVFFDLDGTLFPSRDFSRRARAAAIQAMVREGARFSEKRMESTLSGIVKQRGSNYPRHFDTLLASLHVEKSERPRLVAAAVRAYHDAKMDLAPFPGTRQALVAMKRAGLRLFIASEGVPVKQWEKLMRLGLHDLFEGVFICREKNKAFFASALRSAGIHPGDARMVGDSFDKDVRPAWAAGMGVTWIRAQGDSFGCSLTELSRMHVEAAKSIAEAKAQVLEELKKSRKSGRA